MKIAANQHRPESVEVAERRFVPVPGREDRRFRLALFVALMAHAAMFASLFEVAPRQLGQLGGIDDAISIELVSDTDLRSRATVAEAGSAALGPGSDDQTAAPFAVPLPAPSPPPQRANEPVHENTPPQQPKASDEPPRATPNAPLISLEEAMAMLQAKPGVQVEATARDELRDQANAKGKAPAKTSAQQPNPMPKPAANSALAMKLDLTLPQSAFMQQPFLGGRGGVERPPGYTRSGENDDFARGVIRGLQGTMPQLRDTIGRVGLPVAKVF